MNLKLLQLLVCPKCKSKLKNKVTLLKQDSVIEGYLFCSICNVFFPIEDGIVNFI